MNETELLARLGGDVPPLPDRTRTQVRARLIAKAEGNDVVPARRRRFRTAAAVAGVAAAAAAAGVFAVQPGGAAPAYAVEKKPDGSVNVIINDLHGPKQLEAGLRKAGVPAMVDFVPYGYSCRRPRGTVNDLGMQPTYGEIIGPKMAFTISADQMKAGSTVVIEAMRNKENSKDHRYPATFAMDLFDPPVARCDLVNKPLDPRWARVAGMKATKVPPGSWVPGMPPAGGTP